MDSTLDMVYARRPGRHLLNLAPFVVAVAFLAGGCAGDDEPTLAAPPSDAPIPSGPGSTSEPGPSQASGSPDRRPADQTDTPEPAPGTVSAAPGQRPITISFAGDVHFEGALRSRLDDPADALAPISTQLSGADLTIANLESSVGTGGSPEPKRYTFQAPPSAFDALAAAGVDVVTMANNHAMDYGTDGLAETLDAAEQAADADSPLSVVGVGDDVQEAFEPAVLDVDGTTVAVLGASMPDDPTADPTHQWAAEEDRPGVAVTLDPRPLLNAVESAQAEADVVVVYMHWGVQGDACPSDSQQELAGSLAESGADVVVGSHTHRLQGAGVLDDTYVSYGLGNFAWYTQSSEATSTTGMLTLTVDDGRVTQESWDPATIQSDGLPEFADGTQAGRMTEDF
ncbi:CapA family protein, partial [Phytoactinopolyspora endophytica]|uniref:CapA family protein n=1 Tax=Phytoactinopolyspora endophytica TaxID=1642495 RepID=UPI0013EE0AAA